MGTLMRFYCLFDGFVLKVMLDFDRVQCSRCGMAYSGQFLEKMQAEHAMKRRHPSSGVFYQGELDEG